MRRCSRRSRGGPASARSAEVRTGSALEAEIRAKAALLAGPRQAAAQLPHGGVVVLDDGSHRVIEPPLVVTLGQLTRFA
jgi:hypothetical protein